MRIISLPTIIAVLGVALSGCNQPFEPNGPVSNKLVMYSILSASSDTQYVRLSTTFGDAPAPDVRNAIVQLVGQGRTFLFRDTTVQWLDALGNPAPTNVYVAYHAAVNGGQSYQLQARTPGGLSATANVTALSAPTFSVRSSPTLHFFTLDTKFMSASGAFVLRFYVDYYALVEGGLEYHREEVPIGQYIDQTGNLQYAYPQLSLVQLLAHNQEAIPVRFDSTQYVDLRTRVLQRYQGGFVVFFQLVFSLTQIDDVLYSYYFFNNGPVDQSTIRLDQPDFTNITNGYGVFGSRAQVVRQYRLAR